MGSFGNFVEGLIVGAVVGAGVAFFATPRTGDETRAELQSFWNNAVDTGKQAAKQREEELWSEFNVRVNGQSEMPATTAPGLTGQDRPQLGSSV